MKLFFVGDFIGNNGPASVNRSLKRMMPNNTLFTEETRNYKRILELLMKIIKADTVLFSGLSKITIIGLRLAKLFGKKSAYLMHGNAKLEGSINQTYNKKDVYIENKILELTPKIICVSKFFMDWMLDNYPQYKRKITFVNNGVDWDLLNLAQTVKVKRKRNYILSVGGGVPQKNILSICEAIDYLNKKEDKKIKLFVIGKNGKDTETIKSFSFVQYINEVGHDEMVYFYKMAQIYIQNSTFETFGLAPIEAVLCGSDLLISNNVGAKSIIEGLKGNDIIYDNGDVSEIINKIISLLNEGNNNRVLNLIDRNDTSYRAAVEKIFKILKDSVDENER